MDPQALELANRTLAAAIDSLMSKGSPVAPLVFVEKDGKHEPRRVAASRNEDPAAIAKQMASDQEGADATAYAVDGVITFERASSRGIIVEAWNFATGRGARIGLRYELKGAMRKRATLLGSTLYLARGGWYDPEDGEPSDVPTFPEMWVSPGSGVPQAPFAVPQNFGPPPAAPQDFGPPPTALQDFGPPPSAASLAPPESAPPPPAAAAVAPAAPAPSAAAPSVPAPSVEPIPAVEPPALPIAFSAPPAPAAPAEPAAPAAGEPTAPPSRPLPQWDPPVLRAAPAASGAAGTAAPDFGPPPTTAPVPGFDPPASALQAAPPSALPVAPPPPVSVPAVPVPTESVQSESAPTESVPTDSVQPALGQPAPVQPAPAARPPVDTAPPTAAHPVDVPSRPAAVPAYVPVPLQRNETPLGNRAMFAGIMELATKGRSFPAFAIVQKDGVWEQVTMTDASLADAAASVRVYASSRTDAEFIAFAIDGTVPVEGTAVPAVIVEVWEYATRVSFSVAQRYVPTGDPPSPRLSGRPLMRTQAGWVDVPSSMMLGGQVQFGYRDPDSA